MSTNQRLIFPHFEAILKKPQIKIVDRRPKGMRAMDTSTEKETTLIALRSDDNTEVIYLNRNAIWTIRMLESYGFRPVHALNVSAKVVVNQMNASAF